MGQVLVVRGGAIGDFILTLPAIQLIRASLPDPHIAVLGYRNVVDVAVEFGIVDEARSIEYGSMAQFFVPGAKLDEELSRWLGSFDLVVSYLYDPDGYFAGNIERCKVETFLQAIHKVDDDPSQGHAAGQLARPLEQLAMFLECPAPTLDFSRVPSRDASELIVDSEKRWIAIHPGSGSPRKNWPVEKWFETCRALQAADDLVHFAIVTGEADTESGEGLVSMLQTSGCRFTRWHARPLPELAWALRKCALFLGHDSGISHLAAASGARSVLLFGPTDSCIWSPQNQAVRVIEAAAGGAGKMDDISSDEVIGAALEALAGYAKIQP
jgi:heptosyltransferase-3